MLLDALRTVTACATVVVTACGVLPQPAERAPPPATERHDPSLSLIAKHLETMSQLTQATPSTQAEIVQSARDAAELAPTTSNRLSYALTLATPNHGQSDPAAARQMLTELLATPEALLPAERALAWVVLQDVEQRLILQAENTKLQGDAARIQRETSADIKRRLQAELEENARLKKALAEAQAKLDEIARIERSIAERNPSNGSRSP